jgi:2-keto-4-pentenoate hydratase/2-oxohepta-3-ene-1,7-dioic acid hydratase in catechol pathway
MLLVTFAPSTGPAAGRPRLGAVHAGGVVDLAAAALAAGAREGMGGSPAAATDMAAFLAGGERSVEAAGRCLDVVSREGRDLRSPAGDPVWLPDGDIRLLPPIRPASIRDVVGFEDHARAGAARRGAELFRGWHDRPFYYRGNHRAVLGPEDEVVRPSFTTQLDFELEVACVVGQDVRDAGEDEAAAAILGFTVMNDWSARDVQRAEMDSRMGPSKSKDFATSLGPCILLAERGAPQPAARMTARVNGRIVCDANLAAATWTFPAVIAFASRDETVAAGDVFGSGTPFGGCMLDHGGPWLEPGDVVELEVEGIGVLRNRIAAG